MFKKMSCLTIVLSFLLVAPVYAKTMINIGTAGAGGSWYAAVGAIADIINNNVDGVIASAQTTGGAVANVKLLGTKKIQMCVTINVVAQSASEGQNPFTEAYSNLRSILPNLEKGFLQVFTLAGSDINYVSELKGRKVMVGPQGHGSLIRLRQIFPVMGFGFDEVKAVYLPYEQAMTALGDRKVDAVVLYMAYPALAAKQFGTTRDIKLLRVKDEHRTAVLAKFPFYLDLVVPAGTYKGQQEDVKTVGTGNGLYMDSGVDADLAYKITKAIFDNVEKLRASHPSVKHVSLETATQGALVEFHPGAMKYYKEKGVWTGK